MKVVIETSLKLKLRNLELSEMLQDMLQGGGQQ